MWKNYSGIVSSTQFSYSKSSKELIGLTIRLPQDRCHKISTKRSRNEDMVSLMGDTQVRQGLVHSSIRGQGIETKNTLISSQIRSCKTGLTFSLDTAPSKRLAHCNAPVVPKPNLSLPTALPSRLNRCTPRNPNGREAGIRLETCNSQRPQLWARREANFYGTC